MQNLITSKYIAHFLEEVSSWQKKLSTADSVIGIWLEVQRTWSHLESIFIGSEDIRKQLPEDSARFDGIDSDFKVSLIYYAGVLVLTITISQPCNSSIISVEIIMGPVKYTRVGHGFVRSDDIDNLI